MIVFAIFENWPNRKFICVCASKEVAQQQIDQDKNKDVAYFEIKEIKVLEESTPKEMAALIEEIEISKSKVRRFFPNWNSW